MNSLRDERIAQALERLHRDADAADRHLQLAMRAMVTARGSTDELIARMLTLDENYQKSAHDSRERFLAVEPEYGQFLYMTARACKARQIVEFGTSMGISTIYLAAALRDNGGGRLVSAELEPDKVARARANLDAAGVADLVEVREGDAMQTLAAVEGPVDLLLIDGALTLYLPILRLIEPKLAPGAIVLAENAFDPAYRDYIADPANGYLSLQLPDAERGNTFAVRL